MPERNPRIPKRNVTRLFKKIRRTAMPVDQAQLSTALKQAKTIPMRFAFVAKGAEGRLLVEKKKVPAKEVANAKKECGGGTIFAGRCLFEDGTMVFEVPVEPPGTLENLIKKIIKSDAAQTMHVIVRVNPALASEEEDEQHETAVPASEDAVPSPPPPPEHDGSAVMKRLSAMSPDIKNAMNGPNKARVQSLFLALNGQIKGKDFAQADSTLDELAEAIATASVAPPPAPPPPTGGADVIKRLNALTGKVKEALAGPHKARVQSLFIAVNGFIKTHDYEQASHSLDELENLLASPPQTMPEKTGDGGEQFMARLKTLLPDIHKAQTSGTPVGNEVKLAASEANTLARGKQFAEANLALDRVEALLKQVGTDMSSDNAEPAPLPATKSAVSFAKAKLAWNNAKRVVGHQLKALKAAIKADVPEEASAATRLNEILERFNEGLGDTLDGLYTASNPDERQSLTEKAKAIVLSYEEFLHSDPLVKHVEKHPFEEIEVAVRKTLIPNLEKIRQQL
jgi:hypothetical protein